VARKNARSWEFVRVSSLVEISFFRSEMSPPRADAVFKETIIMQAVTIALTHLIANKVLSKEYIDD
jgi:hypothetical protein